MNLDLDHARWRLTDDQVKLTLAGYDSSRAEILDFLLSEAAFNKTDGPFGFDLRPVDAIRVAIKKIVSRRGPMDGERECKLDPFRRELIFATADATRHDAVRLVLHLYLALMERHAMLDRDAEPPGGPASRAGEYLLRCLVVQAAYDNLATYSFILEQFARVVAAIKLAPTSGAYAHMLAELLAKAAMPLDDIVKQLPGQNPMPEGRSTLTPRRLIGIDKKITVSSTGYVEDQHLRNARALGAAFANGTAVDGQAQGSPKWVVLVRDRLGEDGPSAAAHVQTGALETGGRVVLLKFEKAKRPAWSSTGQVMKLVATKTHSRTILAACKGAPVTLNQAVAGHASLAADIGPMQLKWPDIVAALCKLPEAVFLEPLSLFIAAH